MLPTERSDPSAERSGGATIALGIATLGLAILLFLAFGLHTYHPSDHGLMLAGAWRVFGGQVPYRDFACARPPGSLYLHTLEIALLPETWSFLATRLSFYLLMSASAFLPAWWALRAGLARSRFRLGVLSLCFLLIALHNFPVMPWHTVDGIFFGSLGITAWMASRSSRSAGRRLGWRCLASVSLVLAALCKQAYAVLPAALGALAFAEWWTHSRASDPIRAPTEHHRLLLAAIFPGALLLAAIGGAFAWAGALAPAASQISGSSTFGDLQRAGLTAYFRSPAVLFAAPGLALALLHSRLESSSTHRKLRVATAVAVYAWVAWMSLSPGESGQSIFFFVLGVLAGRALALRGVDPTPPAEPLRLFFQGWLLLLAWAASISWSTTTPLLGLAGAAVAFEDLIPRIASRRLERALVIATLTAVLASVCWANYWHPYRDTALSRQTASLDAIFPRFGALRTNPGHAERMAELAVLIERHATGRDLPFTVLTSYPLIHFLTGTQSPTRLDWYLPLEVRGHIRAHREELSSLDGVIFFQREPFSRRIPLPKGTPPPCRADEFESSPNLLRPVFSAGVLLESTHAFCAVEMRGLRRETSLLSAPDAGSRSRDEAARKYREDGERGASLAG